MTFSLPEIVLAGQRRVTEVAPFRRRVAAEHGHQVDDDPDETADDAQCQQQPYHGAQSNEVPPQSAWEPNAMRGTAVR